MGNEKSRHWSPFLSRNHDKKTKTSSLRKFIKFVRHKNTGFLLNLFLADSSKAFFIDKNIFSCALWKFSLSEMRRLAKDYKEEIIKLLFCHISQLIAHFQRNTFYWHQTTSWAPNWTLIRSTNSCNHLVFKKVRLKIRSFNWIAPSTIEP